MVLFVLNFTQIVILEKFINVGLDTVRSERVKGEYIQLRQQSEHGNQISL